MYTLHSCHRHGSWWDKSGKVPEAPGSLELAFCLGGHAVKEKSIHNTLRKLKLGKVGILAIET